MNNDNKDKTNAELQRKAKEWERKYFDRMYNANGTAKGKGEG